MEEEQQNNSNNQFSQLEQQLIDAIQESLENSIPSNATFLAERLVAEKDIESTRNILAECYLAENKPYKAYFILQKCSSEQNRYKFAQACVKLNKFKQAEKALLGNIYPYNQNQTYQQQQQKQINVPNGSFGYYLLGVVCERQFNQKDALEYFGKALDLNPTMWVAYEKLCKLGERIVPSKVFNENHYKIYIESQNIQKTNQKDPQSLKYQKFHQDPVKNIDLFEPQQGQQSNLRSNNNQKISLQNSSIMSTGQGTSNMGQQIQTSSYNYQFESRQQNQQQHRKNLSLGGNSFASSTLQSTQSNYPTNMTSSQIIQEQQQQPQSISTLYPQNKNSNNNNNKKKPVSQSGINEIWTLFQKLATPYQLLTSYQCQEAIKYFEQLPKNHYNTGWVLTNIGRCYMEIVKYSEAEKYYQESFKLEPYRLEGLEYYSACLWQLKKQVDLCWLANNAIEKNPFAPETWIAIGNCFSLNKDNENALKFFNRAIQINPNNAYAHCLSGHEFVYNEDFQKAKKCFDHALNLDIRHYNAWWGLGNIYYKQEQYDKALDNFQKSIEINDKNPVLYSFMAMTLSAKREYIHALDFFKQSEKLDPQNGLNKYQKATTLFKLERYKEALKELEQLYQLMPREAPIPMLMGQIFKKMGDKSNAMRYFNLALDLETKDQQRIKSFIESLQNSSTDFQEEEIDM